MRTQAVKSPEAIGGSAASTNVINQLITVPMYDISDLDGSTLTRQGEGLLLVTSPRQYNYSAFGVFNLPGIENHSRRVEVALQVLSGEVQVGWVGADRKDWAAEARAGFGKHILELIVPAGTVGGQFVIQNQAPNVPSRVLIEKIFILPNDPRA